MNDPGTSAVPGGVTEKPTAAKIKAFQKTLRELQAFIDNIYIPDVLAVADGCIVGSALKLDGDTWKAIDPARAEDFMARVREARGA